MFSSFQNVNEQEEKKRDFEGARNALNKENKVVVIAKLQDGIENIHYHRYTITVIFFDF